MIAASENLASWQTVMMVVFALTYSLISTLSLYKLQSMFAIVCFAVLDGFAVLTHLSEHSANFKTIVGVYFGIYTTYTLIVAYVIKRHDEAKDEGSEIVEGHNAQYWHNCFVFQKQRADGLGSSGNKMIPTENAEAESKPQPIAESTAKVAIAPCAGNEENAKMLLSIKKAFNRMKDPGRRRERIKDLPENIKEEICKTYNL